MTSIPEIVQAPLYFQGRGALAATMRALGVEPDAAVALQAFTCVAVPEGILGAGGRPVYVDIEAGGVNMDPQAFEETIRRTPIRAVVVQHTFGVPVDPAIYRVARERGIAIIEDCCHTITSSVNQMAVGDQGDAAFTSFEWGKTIVAGLGGAAWSGRSGIAKRLREHEKTLRPPPSSVQVKISAQYAAYRTLYRPNVYWTIRDLQRRATKAGVAVGNFGEDRGDAWTPHIDALRWRMWSMGPLLARRSAARLPVRLRYAQAWAEHYEKAIVGVASTIGMPEGSHVDWLRYPIIPDAVPKDEALQRARAVRLEMAAWYETPVHPLRDENLHRVGYEPGSCPEAERRCGELVSLSVAGRLDQRRLDRLTTVLRP